MLHLKWFVKVRKYVLAQQYNNKKPAVMNKAGYISILIFF